MKPTICLTFANSPVHPLQHLKEESRELYNTLKESQGKIQLEREESVTLEDLKQVIRQYGPALVILHYAGHAGSNSIGTEDTITRAAALGDFMQAQGIRELPLLVLNGCATQALVKKFHSIGVQAIIATSVSVDDRRASVFAVEFYQSLVTNHKSLQDAFSAGIAAVNADATLEEVQAKIYRNTGFEGEAEEIPWGLYIQTGQDQILQWTFREAIDDPLLGIPEISQSIKLPSDPFKPLSHYKREDARIFFGRNKDIRRLYDRIENPIGDNIILLYGQSGVGKSSLISAGLIPRLEEKWKIAAPIREEHSSRLKELMDLSPYTQGDKVLLIFDQLEELITMRPTQDISEMEVFLHRLLELFSTTERSNHLKILLGFRKEYFAEIHGILNDAKIGFLECQLRPIVRKSIIEVVTGLISSQYLKMKYNLQIEAPSGEDKLLPQQIADDILQDRQSNIAPALQILMSKMWKMAMGENSDAPTFKLNNYFKLKQQGLLLEDYVKEILDMLGNSPEQNLKVWAESGLLLDLLNHFVNKHQTATRHALDHLIKRYKHIPSPQIKALLKLCQDHFLLTEGQKDKFAPVRYRLSHDALGPIVHGLFDRSERPGQRAWRIIMAKKEDVLKNPENSRFSESDIDVIEKGKNGLAEVDQVLWQKIEEDQCYYRLQKKERFDLLYSTALEEIQYPQFDQALRKLKIAQHENILTENPQIEQCAKELIFPLAFLKVENQLKEALQLLLAVGENIPKHWKDLQDQINNTDFPRDNLYNEMQEWFHKNEPSLLERMNERFFPKLLKIPGKAFGTRKANEKLTFKMGVKGNEVLWKNEGPAHMVALDPYELADTPITFWQYGLYCLATKRNIPPAAGQDRGDHPVVNVSWYEAIAYCNWLSQQKGLQLVYALETVPEDPNDLHEQIHWDAITNWHANGFRLPTEAEWEFAASAKIEKNTLGNPIIGKWRFGNGKDIVDPDEINFNGQNMGNSHSVEKGWMKQISKDKFRAKTTPVKAYAQSNNNPFGLHDLSGNVFEWCWDYDRGGPQYKRDKYFIKCRIKGKVDNPRGEKNRVYRVVRGGSWFVNSYACRSSYRHRYYPDLQYSDLGFRLARR